MAGKKTAFVVGDDAEFLGSARAILQRLGYEVLASSDAAPGSARLDPPSLVLIDGRAPLDPDDVRTLAAGGQGTAVVVAGAPPHLDRSVVSVKLPLEEAELPPAIERATARPAPPPASGAPGADAERWFRELVSVVSDGVVAVGADGRVRFLNAVAERILGRTVADVAGRPADEVLRGAHVARRTDVRDAAGRSSGSLLVLASRDAPHYEVLGLLAAGVGHKLNDALQAIVSHADVLAERLPRTPPAWRDSAETIRRTGQGAAAIVAKMTRVARGRSPARRPHELSELVRAAASRLSGVLPANVEVRTSLANPMTVWVDPVEFGLIVEHLVRNAADAMPQGGAVTLAVSMAGLGGEAPEPGPHPMLAVTDTGSGIPRSVLDHLFEPFLTTHTHDTKGRLGLGLSVVYELVHRIGGFIEVESAEGRGTTFKIHWPSAPLAPESAMRAPAPAQPEAGEPVAAREELRGTETVLLAEDSDAIRGLICEELGSLGYRVLEASRGDEALEVARRHDGAIHVLVSDVKMPGMSGLELARTLRAQRPALHIVFLSGYVNLALNQRMGRELGAEFISKPFPLGVLARRIRQLVAGGT
jgi:signal transduction histidine kinase